ncbi:MAG: cation diffusion facilitator family transporter [Dehalococcoidia bacterium]|nr:cation diffusion facilitator family transporter [Dehalococcoidia bacterium]
MMLATKENAAKLSIVAVSLLIIMKVVASIITGSIAIRADAVHSAIDLLAVVIGYIGIRISGKPPDEQHAFGHGKAENIASTVIAGLIFVAAGAIAYQAVKRLIFGGTVELVTVGIYVTAAAIVLNGIISWYASRVARSTDSLALEATARDMFADVLSSCAVLVGLILVRLTGISILDPIVALLVAAVIVRTAYLTIKKSFGGLIDVKLPEAEEGIIRSCILEHSGNVVAFHELRTRKAGSQRYIDLHLVMPRDASVEQAHRMCDHLEQDIETRLSYTDVTIHVEPCTIECTQCSVSCALRKKRR